MAKLIDQWRMLAGPLGAAALGVFIVMLIFMSPVKNAKEDMDRAAATLEEARDFLARRPALLAEWEKKKNFFDQNTDPDAVLNIWIKGLLSTAQSQGLSLEKLEPAGLRSGVNGKSLAVFISFKGDIRKFVKFTYELLEKDPLSSIESFSVRQEEDSKVFSFELLLGKAIR